MVKRVQIVGHETSEANDFTGFTRELTIDVTNNELRIHDGATAGGHRVLNITQNDSRYILLADEAVTFDTITEKTADHGVDIESVTLKDGLVDGVDIAPFATAYLATDALLDAHIANAANPHAVTKAQVGLGNVTDNAQLKIASNLSDLNNAATARQNLGVEIGVNVQAFDADLAVIAALGWVADNIMYGTGAHTVANTPLTAYGRSLIDDADAAAARTTLGIAYPKVGRRQAVMSGPVDANGAPSYGTGVGLTTLSIAGDLVVTAAGGADLNGHVDRISLLHNPSLAGLNTNGVRYIYVDIDADGVGTMGSGTLAPNYVPGSVPSIVSGQFTYNIEEGIGYVGNGAAAVQAYRVYIGEVLIAANVISTITMYALNGRCRTAFTATLPSASNAITKTHNLGINTEGVYGTPTLILKCTTIDVGYAVNDLVYNPSAWSTNVSAISTALTDRNTMQASNGNTGSGWALTPKTGGTALQLTAGRWSHAMAIDRNW